MSNALKILITIHLLSSIQRLHSASTLCFALDKLDTYVLLYFLPALCIFEGKGAVDPPYSPQKRCVSMVQQHFSKYIVQNLNFFWNVP